MSLATSNTMTYRDQIQRCVQAMALGYAEDVRPFLVAGMSVEKVRLFTEDNIEKRIGKIHDQIEFLVPVFDDLDDLIQQFVREAPLAAYDTGCSDSDRFLKWIRLSQELSSEQHDYIACQLARQEVEAIARGNRLGHVRFQELWRMVPAFQREIETNARLRILLNPIRTWARFQTDVLIGAADELPADVLFFACGNQVRTSVFEGVGQQHLETLASHGPLTLENWRRFERSATRSDLIEFCLDASEMGLVAFG